MPEISSPEVEDAINGIACSIKADKTIIFCGAGISRDSGFPIVDDFVPYVLLMLCSGGEGAAIEDRLKIIVDNKLRRGRLKQIVAEKMEVTTEIVDKVLNNLPFEAFMEILRDNSEIDEINKIYDAKEYQPNVEPNTNHILLARLFVTGKVRTIVTTNFDDLLEKAIDRQNELAGFEYDVVYRDEDFEAIDWTQDRPRLIKIHGSIDDKQAMAITLSQVARHDLSAARAAIIRQIFSLGDHKNVLVLGYSCSDIFDLSPQIEALTDNLKQVLLVQHTPPSDAPPKVEKIHKQEKKNPFKAFENGTRLFIDTGGFVEALWKATLNEPYHIQGVLKTAPDWHVKVNTWYLDSIRTRTRAINNAIPGKIFHTICEWQAAISEYDRVIIFAKEHANDRLESLALGNIGVAYVAFGEYRKAIEYYGQSLEIARRIEDHRLEGFALGNIGVANVALGQYRKAIEYYEQHLAISRSIKDVRGEGVVLGNIGVAWSNLGQYRKAIEYYEQYLAIARHIGEVRAEGIILANIGEALGNLGDFRKAIERNERALEIARRIGNAQSESRALANMGAAYIDLGDYHKAIELNEQALAIARCIRDLLSEEIALSNLGGAHGNLGDFSKAIEFYEKALNIALNIRDAQGEGNALGNIGGGYLDLGEYLRAIEFYERHLQIARSIEDVRGEGIALINIGFAYASMGEKERAAQAFAESKAIFIGLELPHMVRTVDKTMKQVGL